MGAFFANALSCPSPGLGATPRAENQPPPAATLDLTPLLPAWNPFYSVSLGAGYKDNLLLSHGNQEVSGFATAGFDFTLWRRPLEDGREFQMTLNGVDRRYWADRSVDHEDWAFGRARYLHELGPGWIWVTDLDASYFDLALDLTYVETNPRGAQLRGASLGGLSGIRRRWESVGWLQVSPLYSRTWLSGAFDPYQEVGAQASFQRAYGHRSEWRMDYTGRIRVYDERRAVDGEGREIPDTRLRYARHDLGWTDRHYWDEGRRWLSATKVGGLISTDNGSGYFNYWRLSLLEQLEFQTRRWSFRVEGGVGHYRFPHQSAGVGLADTRERTDLTFGGRIEHRLTRWLKLQVEYTYDRALANDVLEAYSANTVQVGTVWEF